MKTSLRRCLAGLMATLSIAAPWAAWSQLPPAAAAEGRALPDFVSSIRLEESVVVSLTTTRRTPYGDADHLPDFLPVPNRRSVADRDPWPHALRPGQARHMASGVVISSEGEILTNAHAVADAERTVVRLADGRQFLARVVGLDRVTDIALVRIDARGLPAASIGDSGTLSRGDWVVAIGSPFGLEGSATAGIVSASQRVLPGQAGPLIQTDVAINPGSSGGALFNARGELVGINSMILSETGAYMGVSFAVPIAVAMKVADELRSSGRVRRGQLGAKIQEVTPDLARCFGLRGAAGALVTRVAKAGPAQRAGLRSGDIVLGLGSRTDTGFLQLQQEVAAAPPGQALTLNIWRRGAPQRLVLAVAEAPADLPATPEIASGGRDERLGLSLGELPASRRDRLGIEGGVAVLDVHGAAAAGGVEPDDVVVAVGDRPVRDPAGFDAALAAAAPGRPVALLVMRDGMLAYLAVEPDR